MSFSELIGNNKVKSLLDKMIERQAIANSLLFSGPQGVGKGLFAEQFAKKLLGPAISTDLTQFYPEGKVGLHPVEIVRDFSEQVYLAPFEAKWKVFIIHDADRMQPVSYNTLLKTFEEPAKDAVIILTTSAYDKMPPTLLSRCRHFPFARVPESEIASWLQEKHQVPKDKAIEISQRAHGAPARALKLLKKPDPLEEKMLDSLSTGALYHYSSAQFLAKELAEMIDQEMKELATAAPKEYTATQKEMLDKQCDGFAALLKRDRFETVTEVLFSWHHDLQVQALGGDETYLLLKQHKQATKNSRLIPFDVLEKAVKSAKLSLERSTTLALVFENLFLQLI